MLPAFFCLQGPVKIETLHKRNSHFQHFLISLFSFHAFCTDLDAQAAAKIIETFKKNLIVSIFADVLDIFPVNFYLRNSQSL